MMDSQAADFYFVPHPGPLRTGPLFHQLDTMTREPCSLEFCSRTPGPTLVYRSYLRPAKGPDSRIRPVLSAHVAELPTPVPEQPRLGRAAPGAGPRLLRADGGRPGPPVLAYRLLGQPRPAYRGHPDRAGRPV